MTLERITRFSVAQEIVRGTEEQLRKAGRDGYELFVLWSGNVERDRFFVRTQHVPKQTSYKLEGGGLCVRVDGDALHELNSWLYENREILGVQVHAHPTEAFHSDTDDTFPIVTVAGGLSVVAPDFCNRDLLGPRSAAFRLIGGIWIEQPLSVIEVR